MRAGRHRIAPGCRIGSDRGCGDAGDQAGGQGDGRAQELDPAVGKVQPDACDLQLVVRLDESQDGGTTPRKRNT